MYNLTEKQKDLAKWLVQAMKAGTLDEEFLIVWLEEAVHIGEYRGPAEDMVPMTRGALDALASAGLMLCHPRNKTTRSGSVYEASRHCVLLGRIVEAVDSDFNAPDTSFAKHLTPLADITNLDNELKQRCLPMLGAGAADPAMWDNAMRTAVVILEERLHDVGGVPDRSRFGRNLVMDLFRQGGTLAHKIDPLELDGYRDLYSGIVGMFRNQVAHHFVDPTPEDGGAFLVFIDLLLRKLEALR